MVLTIEAKRILEDVHTGDSIAVNGVCLTVTAYDNAAFSVDVMPETFRQTNLKHLAVGSKVNLERAMTMKGRFGGHIVQGHVDGTGTVVARQSEENAVVFRIEPENTEILKYIIPRGSITLDGISLTVIQVTDGSFAVSIIPHTLAETVLRERQPGDGVNIECDLLGKYVERLLAYRLNDNGQSPQKKSESITERFLAENGFI